MARRRPGDDPEIVGAGAAQGGHRTREDAEPASCSASLPGTYVVRALLGIA